jgi:hypothetical protein
MRQTAYVHPKITGDTPIRYFEWMGAAMFTADRRTGSMHGKQFLLDAVHAGIDEENLYGRLDFAAVSRAGELVLTVQCAVTKNGNRAEHFRLDTTVRRRQNNRVGAASRRLERLTWRVHGKTQRRGGRTAEDIRVQDSAGTAGRGVGSGINLRFAVYQGSLPVDALPVEGSLDVKVLPEEVLAENAYAPNKRKSG